MLSSFVNDSFLVECYTINTIELEQINNLGAYLIIKSTNSHISLLTVNLLDSMLS